MRARTSSYSPMPTLCRLFLVLACGVMKCSSDAVTTSTTGSVAIGVPKDGSRDNPKPVPAGWDAALAGDQVMARLVNTSASRVKGAHDAEFVCVGERAYVVAEANDLKAGESA